MSTYLEAVTVWGERSTMPGIPNRNLPGAFYDESVALVFRSTRGGYSLTVAWEQVKECYAFSIDQGGFSAFLTWLSTLGVIEPREWYVRLTYYTAEHDMTMAVDFYVGTSTGSLLMERRATNLAKAIWTCRSEHIQQLREKTTIRLR